MKVIKLAALFIVIASLATLTGCGISKDKYNSLLSEKISLEEKVNVLIKSRDALKNEYDNLLKDKMDIATKLETVINEKNALKGEYDKLLDEKVATKAAYDKLLADTGRNAQ
jgi:predicted nuclease with TOPRIM domain